VKSKTVIITIIAAILVVGAGAIYFATKGGDSTATTTSTESSSNSSQSTNGQQEKTTKVSLSSALSKIGATGSDGPVNGNTYTLNGVEYKFEEPTSWDTSLNQRKQACDAGYVGTSYQVATDGTTWFATTDNNDDYGALITALKGAGLNATVASYC
jgi:hypothetical protein